MRITAHYAPLWKETQMAILVTYASKHGATEGIAERVTQRLRIVGRTVDLQPISDDPNPESYDAVVIGSAVYFGSWLKEATAYVHRHRDTLAARPIWLFSDGPLGSEATETNGGEVQPRELAEFQRTIYPQGHQIFFGALDGAKLTLPERIVVKAVRAPEGDFRDWAEVDAWATSIAHQLPLARTAPIP